MNYFLVNLKTLLAYSFSQYTIESIEISQFIYQPNRPISSIIFVFKYFWHRYRSRSCLGRVCDPGPTAWLRPPRAASRVCELGPTSELGPNDANRTLSHGSQETRLSFVSSEPGSLKRVLGSRGLVVGMESPPTPFSPTAAEWRVLVERPAGGGGAARRG